MVFPFDSFQFRLALIEVQALCFEIKTGDRLTFAHAFVSRYTLCWLFTRGDLNELLEQLLVVALDVGLLHGLLVLMYPLLVPEEPLLVVLAELDLLLGFSADLFAPRDTR